MEKDRVSSIFVEDSKQVLGLAALCPRSSVLTGVNRELSSLYTTQILFAKSNLLIQSGPTTWYVPELSLIHI